MKLSISNIAWGEEYDSEMYAFLKENNFNGLEIAPTRIVKENPYDKLEYIKEFYNTLKNKYDLEISSIQSIWYGRTEKIFENIEERNLLIDYTKKAIYFASTINCKNIVFGCPKNRNINNEDDIKVAIEFFTEIAEYADSKGTIIAVEANPVIYGTNFLNTTIEAIDFVKKVNSNGIGVNLDIGTIIYNNENLDEIIKNIHLINHIHISEPNLELIQKRNLHDNLSEILKKINYNKYVSIEMKNLDDINLVKNTINYVKGVF
ncbi:MAG: sugar phosphate isomerase/epimerase [Clostridia bacterium]|nr:sugar phosphate isomerase/epimerase [Clostridia bacterium]